MQSTANNNSQKTTRRDRRKVNSRESLETALSSQGKSNIHDLSDPCIQALSGFASTVRETSYETNSCPIIDDRSNSASPTRRQPHPSGMNTFRGFGQVLGNEERILEWPPPEPRPPLIRPAAPQFGVMFGGLPRLQQNPDIWFFGPTANIQHLIFDSGPEVIDLEDENLNDEISPQVSQEPGSTFHRTASDLSLNTDPRTLETEGVEGREVNLRVDNTTGGPIRLLVASTSEPRTSEAQMAAESGQSLEEVRPETAPGVSVTPSNEDVHTAVRVHQTNSEPPPRPIFFVIVDTNEGGPADDEQQAAQFQFALMQLLAQLESSSDEEPPVER